MYALLAPVCYANFTLVCDNRDDIMSDAYMSSRLQIGWNHFDIQNLRI